MKDALQKQNKKIDSFSEERILSLFQKEADLFVPNKIDDIQKEIPLNIEPIEDALFLKNKIHAESEDLIPNVKNEILKATKAEHPFFCWFRKNHIIAFSIATNFMIVITALSAAFVLRSYEKENRSALVSLEISPASSETKKETNECNPYSPSFLFQVDEKGKVVPSSLHPSNYSASLIKKSSSFPTITNNDGASVAASLLHPAYEMGYLEKTNYSSPNKIKITYFTLNTKRAEAREKEYRSIFNQTLKRKKGNGLGTYASVTFTNGLKGLDLSDFSKRSEENKITLAQIYANSAIEDNEYLINFSDLLSVDQEVLNELSSTLFAIRKARLSPCALQSVLKATSTAYSSIKEEQKESQRELIEAKKKELISKIDSFYNESLGPKEKVKELLAKDAYYLVELPQKKENSLPKIYASYFEIRNLIYKNTTWDNLKSLLKEEREIAESDVTFLDASSLIRQETPLDPGDHKEESVQNANEEGGGVIGN